jgi:hypothetical protein
MPLRVELQETRSFWQSHSFPFVNVQVVARLTAVRGSLQDHLEDNPVIYQGVPALLNFLGEICKGLKGRVLGAGSGPLQDLLVRV